MDRFKIVAISITSPPTAALALFAPREIESVRSGCSSHALSRYGDGRREVQACLPKQGRGRCPDLDARIDCSTCSTRRQAVGVTVLREDGLVGGTKREKTELHSSCTPFGNRNAIARGCSFFWDHQPPAQSAMPLLHQSLCGCGPSTVDVGTAPANLHWTLIADPDTRTNNGDVVGL